MEKQIIDQIMDGSLDVETMRNLLKVCDTRKKLYKRLLLEPIEKYATLVRVLFSIELEERKRYSYSCDIEIETQEVDITYDSPIPMMCCAYLLYRIGDVADVKTIWKAKTIDFDAYFEVDGQFLAGAGVEDTIAYLRKKRGRIARRIRKDIERYKRQGAFEPVALARWEKNIERLFEGV